MESIKDLQGPVYDIEVKKHHFKEIERHISDLKELSGPVYQIDQDHNYLAMVKKVQELKELKGNCYIRISRGTPYLTRNNPFRSCLRN